MSGGHVVRLRTGSSSVDVPRKDIANFEIEEYVRRAATADRRPAPYKLRM